MLPWYIYVLRQMLFYNIYYAPQHHRPLLLFRLVCLSLWEDRSLPTEHEVALNGDVVVHFDCYCFMAS